MTIQPQTNLDPVQKAMRPRVDDRRKGTLIKRAIALSQKHLLSIQYPDGYWWAELESNVSITSEMVLLHKIWGTDATRPLEKTASYLRSQQRDHGGWIVIGN